MFNPKTKVDLLALLVNQTSDTPHYSIDDEVSPDEFDDYDILMETCVVIPKGDLSIIINIEEVDQKGLMHFNLFGVSENIYNDNRHVSLSEISLFNDKIIYVNDIIKLGICDSEMEIFELLLTTEGIHHVCSSMFNYLFCCRYLRGYEDTYICGDMTLELN